MPIVPLRTQQGNLPAEADEIIGSFAVVNLSQYMRERTVYFGLSHVVSGWGWAAYTEKDITVKVAKELERSGLDWDSIYARVDMGISMDDMPERDELIRLFRRSFHDNHSLIPIPTDPWMPREIIEEVEMHRQAMRGDAN